MRKPRAQSGGQEGQEEKEAEGVMKESAVGCCVSSLEKFCYRGICGHLRYPFDYL